MDWSTFTSPHLRNYLGQRRYRVMEKAPPIVVIGASAGGIDAIRSLTAAFAAAVFVVLHIGAHKSELLWQLNQTGPLPACHHGDGELIQAGHIYVAPPDHHGP